MAMVTNVAGACSRPFPSAATPSPTPPRPFLAGGNVRVGLEDNLYIGKGELVTNAELVEKSGRRRDGDGRPDHWPQRSESGSTDEALKEAMMSSTSAPTNASIASAACIRWCYRRGVDRPFPAGRRR